MTLHTSLRALNTAPASPGSVEVCGNSKGFTLKGVLNDIKCFVKKIGTLIIWIMNFTLNGQSSHTENAHVPHVDLLFLMGSRKGFMGVLSGYLLLCTSKKVFSFILFFLFTFSLKPPKQ